MITPITVADFSARFVNPRQPEHDPSRGLSVLRTEVQGGVGARRNVRVFCPPDGLKTPWLRLLLVQTLLLATNRRPAFPLIVGCFSWPGTAKFIVVQEEPALATGIPPGASRQQLSFDLLDTVLACYNVGLPVAEIRVPEDLGVTQEGGRLCMLHVQDRLQLPDARLGGTGGLAAALRYLAGETGSEAGDEPLTWDRAKMLWAAFREKVLETHLMQFL